MASKLLGAQVKRKEDPRLITGTSQYVREIADAVTRKAHRQGDMDLRRMSSAASPGALGQPRKAI